MISGIMPDQPTAADHPRDGWRERKRRQTRRRIADAGLRLFLQHGFDATTLDTIAEAAGIARRTFFHYFDSKEALLYAYEDEVEDSFRAVMANVDSGGPPYDAMVLAVREMIARFDADRVRLLDSVARSTEALRTGMRGGHDRLENVLFSALCEKFPSPGGHLRLRLIAMIGIGAVKIAHDRWHADPSVTLQHYVDDTFAALGSGVLS